MVTKDQTVEELLQRYQLLFCEESGMLRGVEAQIHVPPNLGICIKDEGGGGT